MVYIDKNIIFLIGTYVLGIKLSDLFKTLVFLSISAEFVKFLKLISKTLCSVQLYLLE